MPPANGLAKGSQVSDYVEAYEAAHADGAAGPLDSFLPDRGDPKFTCVLAELVRVDMEYAWTDGRPKRLDEYRQAFPELFDDPAILAEVAFEEYRLRRLAGDAATPSEYRRRYGVSVARWPDGASEVPTQRLVAVSDSPAADDVGQDFPKIGSNFLGFTLRRELGRGAFGRVYLAHQGDLAGRPVALKVTRDATVEAQALARLQHTNVMPIYSIHHAPPFHAVCMPHFPGVTLADLCRGFAGDTVPNSAWAILETVREISGAPPTKPAARPETARPIDNAWAGFRDRSGADAVVWIGVRLADALAHAHERGIIHRDLKPANVLLTEDGQPLILDFNLADDTQYGGERAFLGGTLPYMAPEQLGSFLNGKPHGDPRSDVYSVGLILFELLANRPPFPAHKGDWRTAALASLADRQGPPPRLRPLNPAVSPAVEAIVRRCLEPDPERRYPTAGQLREDLQRQFDHLPLRHTPEPSLRERVAKFFRRHPGALSTTRVGVVALMVIVALTAAFIVRSDRLAALEAHRDADRWLADAHSAQLTALRANSEVGSAIESTRALAGLLDRYRVLLDQNWFNAKGVRRLPPEDRDRLRNAVGELLILRARNLRYLAKQTPWKPEPLWGDAEKMNELAEHSFPPDAVPRAVWLQRAELEADQGHTVQAERLRADAASIPLRSARDYVLAAIETRDRDEVTSLLANAEGLNPGDANLWCRMGLAYRNVKKFDRAMTCFEISLILNSEQPWVNEVRGETLLASGDAARAMRDFDIALAAQPADDVAQTNRALARENKEDFAGATADLTAVLKRSPRQVDLLLQRSRVKTKSGDAGGAKADLAALLQSTPTTVRGWVARALAQRDATAALSDLDQALKLDPLSESALQNRANLLSERLNNPAEAIAALDTLIRHHPDSADALAGRGVLLARRSDRAAALRDAQAALAADRRPFTVYQVAGIYAQTSKKEPADRRDALRLLAEAFRRDPSLLNLVSADRDLDPIRADDGFRQLLTAARTVLTAGP